MEVLERLLAAKATVEAEDERGRGAPELGTRPEGCGDCAGSFISSPEEQVSKMFELNERKELTGIVLWSREFSKYTGTASILGSLWHPKS